MTADEKEVRSLLRQIGAVLKRVTNHEVWKLPNGRCHILPRSDGNDPRAWKNNLHQLRRLLAGHDPFPSAATEGDDGAAERRLNPTRR